MTYEHRRCDTTRSTLAETRNGEKVIYFKYIFCKTDMFDQEKENIFLDLQRIGIFSARICVAIKVGLPLDRL